MENVPPSVAVWRKGYSSHCGLSNTLVKSISTVAVGLGCLVDIVKVTRCSCIGSVMADHLSKAEFRSFRAVGASAEWDLAIEPLSVPSVLLGWVDRPVVDADLGHAILRQLSTSFEILGYS